MPNEGNKPFQRQCKQTRGKSKRNRIKGTSRNTHCIPLNEYTCVIAHYQSFTFIITEWSPLAQNTSRSFFFSSSSQVSAKGHICTAGFEQTEQHKAVTSGNGNIRFHLESKVPIHVKSHTRHFELTCAKLYASAWA